MVYRRVFLLNFLGRARISCRRGLHMVRIPVRDAHWVRYDVRENGRPSEDHSRGDCGMAFPLREVTPGATQQLHVRINGDRAFEGIVYASADDPAAPYIVARSRILDVGSPHALTLAKSCLANCRRDHSKCKVESAPDPLLPTRVINCADPHHPYLFHTGNSQGQYLALSYVWGEPQPYRTVLSNISAYEDGMEPSLLSQTIRDAIHVTHALGYQYLWVDALCIIQDSDEDKKHELSRMHRVYRDAHLTIVAASAQRVSEGFLQDRADVPMMSGGRDIFAHDFMVPFICPSLPRVSSNDSNEQPPSLRQLGHLHISPLYACNNERGADWSYNYASEPVSTRGWCMQEHLMSSRALIFASHTLQYKCQTETRNIGEAFHTGYSPQLPNLFFRSDLAATLIKRIPYQRRRMHEAWLRVVSDYSKRTITYPSDKLVACSAIAQEFHSILRTEYLAGLWRNTLLSDLLWYHENYTRTEGARPATYRAPSWSWAAIDGRLRLLAISHQPTAEAGNAGVAVMEVIRCEVSLKNESLPFGEVTGASLVVRAPLIRCVLRRDGWAHEILLQRAWRSRSPSTGHSDDGEDSIEVDEAFHGDAYLDSIEDEECPRMWAALVSRHSLFDRIEGLVVVPQDPGAVVSDGGRIVYRRIGYFAFKSPIFQFGSLIRDMGMRGKLPTVEFEIV
ncbi:heterokaryon incompatibility protein-domain-containing protein [Trametes gibbosa]|nr:heterokaryon incompatibility protein-domain-containing protein [Trametes gibbosa]